LSVLVARSALELCALYCGILALASLSAIGILFFLKRTLVFIPLFSLCIVLPSIFSVVTPGDAVASLSLFGHSLAITKQGLGSASILLMRILDSVSLCVLLAVTTRHHALLKVLRVFGLPQLFVMTMGMTYRYIYLLLDIAQSSLLSVRSRVGYVTSSRAGRKIVGANMGGLWLKSYRLQTQVYDAMLSRGYSGESKVLGGFRARARDFVVLLFSIIFLAGTLWLNRSIR